MEIVLQSAMKAIDDLRAPGMMKLFLSCVGLTLLAVIIVILVGMGFVNSYIAPLLPTEESLGSGLLFGIMNSFFWMFSAAAFMVPMFVLFWSLMIFIASFFDEYIAEKIEHHRYPELAIGQGQPFWQELRQDILFSIKIALANIILIIIPLFWPFWPILFPVVNGYMLGKYFFRMAGGRHIGRKAADRVAKEHRSKILVAGLAMFFASTVPILNLVVPFWGVAMMVHIYHMVDGPTAMEVLPPADNT